MELTEEFELELQPEVLPEVPVQTEPPTASRNQAPVGTGGYISLVEASKLTGIKRATIVGRIKSGKLHGQMVQVGARELWYVKRDEALAQRKPIRNEGADGQVRPDLKVRNNLVKLLKRMPTKLETYAEMQRLGIPLKPFQLKRLEANEAPSTRKPYTRKGRPPMITRGFVDQALGREQNTNKLPAGVTTQTADDKFNYFMGVVELVQSGVAEIESFDVVLRVRQ